MPPNIAIASFIFGAVLILIALLGGRFTLFGAQISEAVGGAGRWVAGFLGAILMMIGLFDPSKIVNNGTAPPPSPTPTIKEPSPPVSPTVMVSPFIAGGDITVRCSVIPHVLAPGSTTEFVIQAISDQNAPLPEANVRVESGGGVFTSSGGTTVVGRTGPDGSFRTNWRAPNPAASSYGMGVYVSKPGFIEGQGQCSVLIQKEAN